MGSTQQKKPKPWQLPESIPGSPDELDETVKALFKTPGDRGSDYQARRTRLTHELHQLAVILLEGLQQLQISPTARALEKDLLRLVRLSQEIVGTLDNLPPAIHDLLNVRYHAQRGWDPTNHRLVDLGLGPAPMALVASAMNLAIKGYLEAWQDERITGRIPPSRSGPSLAVQRLIGDPRSFFTNRIACIFALEFGADMLIADTAGPLYDTVARLWTYATGLPDEHANLRQYVRAATRSAKASQEQMILMRTIGEEARDFYTDQTRCRDPKLQQEFQTRMALLEEQLAALTNAMFKI